MNILGDFFNAVFLAPVINALIIMQGWLQAFHIPGALGWSIILLTVVIRVLVWPLMSAQMRSAKKMMDLKPHLDTLKKKHDKDKQAFTLAQAALFKEHGYNPMAGCLPSLLQIPLIIALYQSISSLFDGQKGLDHINYFLYPFVDKLTVAPDAYFLGLNLSAKPSEFATIGFLVLLVPVLTALLQFVQSKMMAPKAVKEYPSDSPKEKKEKEKNEDAMSAVQTQMTYMMPLMIGYFAFSFPIGLAIYWNTFSMLGIYQQYKVSGWGGLADLVSKIKSKLKS